MRFFMIFLIFVFEISICLVHGQVEMYNIREWKKLDFNFPTTFARNDAINTKKWIPENAFPIDMDVDYYGEYFLNCLRKIEVWLKLKLDPGSLENSRIFVTVPRFSDGIPITLGYVTSSRYDLQITPFPDYSWHSHHGSNCDRITSVLRVAIDECKQLWVLDTGKIGDVQKCPPQIFVFNLRTNNLVRNYKFPASQYTSDSLFINPVRFHSKKKQIVWLIFHSKDFGCQKLFGQL